MSIFLIQLKQTPHKLSFYKIKWISRWLWCFSVYLEYWEKILDFFFTLMSYRQHYCTFSWWKEKYWWYVPSCSLNNNPCKICCINCNWLSIFLWWNYLNFFKGEERGVRCYIKRQQNIFYSKLLAEDISIKIKWHVYHTKSKYLFILKTLIKRLKYYFKVSVFK